MPEVAERVGFDIGFTANSRYYTYNRTTKKLTVTDGARDHLYPLYAEAAKLMDNASTAEREDIIGFMQSLSDRIGTA